MLIGRAPRRHVDGTHPAGDDHEPMQAITYSNYGPPDVLRLEHVPEPLPGDDDLLIRVEAVEATKSDCEMRSFEFRVKWFWLPMRIALGVWRPKRRILGSYFAGVVEAVGCNATGFVPGDEVYGSTRLRLGAYAERMVVPATSTIVLKPRNMTFAEAAAVPLGGLNALHFMHLAHVQPGEAVLVNGAGGSIGAYGVQIAKSMGAQVTAADLPSKEAGCRRFGADHFIDCTREHFASGARRWDVIFDMVPDTSFRVAMSALNPSGRYLAGNPSFSSLVRALVKKPDDGKTIRVAFARESREELRALATMIEAGAIGPITDRVYPMADAVEAHRRVDREQRTGAIVLAIGDHAQVPGDRGE
jgi:NADPH:quinone reductase-like Zn-dependent oxidoreductase